MENNTEEFEMKESVTDYNNNPEEHNEFMRAVRNIEIFFHEIEIDNEIDEIGNEIDIDNEIDEI